MMSDKRAKNSFVWDSFTRVEAEDKVQCNVCKAKLAYGKSTSSMLKHLQAKHSYIDAKRKALDSPER